MKKRARRVCCCACCLVLLLAGCGRGGAQEDGQTVTYSNLADAAVQAELAEAMAQAGISQERQSVFFAHVEQFNSAVSAEELAQGFEQGPVPETKYDPYEMQEEWEAAYPDFLGYNCRITAWGLFGDHVEVPAGAETREDMILMDLSALEEDPSAFLRPEEEAAFRALFSTVPTEATQDVAVHAARLQEDWDARGIRFDGECGASLITVVFHDVWDDADQLFIGHVGVLLTAEDGGLYFVEKLAFQEPYQLSEFADRAALNDYLMAKYDISADQPTAAPFIMENDRLMEGYRRLQDPA